MNFTQKPRYKHGANSIKEYHVELDFAKSEDKRQRPYIDSIQLKQNISTEKTKLRVISREPLRYKLAIDKVIIEQMMEFNYTGAV